MSSEWNEFDAECFPLGFEFCASLTMLMFTFLSKSDSELYLPVDRPLLWALSDKHMPKLDNMDRYSAEQIEGNRIHVLW